MYKCFTILSFLLIFCHRFVSNYENFDTKLLINHAHRARERKKIQNKLFILKESDYEKKIQASNFTRGNRIHIDTAVKI